MIANPKDARLVSSAKGGKNLLVLLFEIRPILWIPLISALKVKLMAARQWFYPLWIRMTKQVAIFEQMQGHILKLYFSALFKLEELKNRINCGSVVLEWLRLVFGPHLVTWIHNHNIRVHFDSQLSKTRFF